MIIINNYCYHSFIHFEEALEKPKRGVRLAEIPQELWAARVDPHEGLVPPRYTELKGWGVEPRSAGQPLQKEGDLGRENSRG